mmetsp:Transcript_4432/g.12540  ORF Transcript_4432/g.12540 Transcript_4432/m.12540 type:complete len:102 (+) Transcript_4432:623-928(+)
MAAKEVVDTWVGAGRRVPAGGAAPRHVIKNRDSWEPECQAAPDAFACADKELQLFATFFAISKMSTLEAIRGICKAEGNWPYVFAEGAVARRAPAILAAHQ